MFTKIHAITGLGFVSIILTMLFSIDLSNVRFELIIKQTQPPKFPINYSVNTNTSNKPKQYVLLFWTSFFGYTIDTKNQLKPCPHLPCVLTTNKSFSNEASAFIYHMQDFSWTDVANVSRLDQYQIFFLHESPVHTYANLQKSPGFFNLTISYRLDSDVPLPYGYASRNNAASWFNQTYAKKLGPYSLTLVKSIRVCSPSSAIIH